MDDIHLWIYAAMFGAALLAGFVDSIAGGGGLITIPALLAVGLPPHAALATNRLQACFGSFSASWHFARSGMVEIRPLIPAVLWVFLCAGLGTSCVLLVSADSLKIAIPFLLIAIFLYVLLTPKIGESERQKRMSPFAFYAIFGAAIGFYDGFLGPGTGSFWTFALVALLGLNMKKAVAQSKILNFASNAFSLLVFIFSGEILWLLGLVMGVGQLLGARIGAGLVIKKEASFVKKIFLIVVFLSICKVVYDLL